MSGFVIFLLLDQRKQTLTQFYLTRFFRLWPLLTVTILVGVWALSFESQNLPQLVGTLRDAEFRIERIHGWRQNLTQHLLVTLSMTNAMVPDRFLENVDRFAVPPTWSIGLEWSFYLVAPFILAALCKGRAAAGLILFCLAFAAFEPTIGYRINPSSLPVYAHFFAIGIASFYLYKYLLLNPERLSKIKFPLIASLITVGSLGGKSVLVWMLVLLAVLLNDGTTKGFFGKIRYILQLRPLTFLGRVSYSTYLTHWIVITFVIYICLNYFGFTPLTLSRSLIPLVLTIGITLIASVVAYYAVECPGIAAGKYFTGKIVKNK